MDERRSATAPDGAASSVTTRDGRSLACVAVGDPDGALVLHNHGGPSSRYEVLLLAGAATAHGLRLVGVDRPGIGQSSPQTPRTYPGWAEDLVAVADALGHGRFGVTGWSEGGPWALAAAACIDPGRLAHVSCIGGASYGAFGENWAAGYLDKADRLGGLLALHMRPGFKLMYEGLELGARHFPASYYADLKKAGNPYDRAILDRPEVEKAFMQASTECFAQGAEGLVRDAEVLYHQWTFDVRAIRRPVHMWQGLTDTFVAAGINRTVSERMPGAIWHPVEDGGHFIAVGAADAILAIAAEDLAA